MAGGPAVSAPWRRCVGISLVNLSRESQPRMSLRISSDGKSRNEARAGLEADDLRAGAGERERGVPPAAPTPTMTTSVFLSLVVMAWPPSGPCGP